MMFHLQGPFVFSIALLVLSGCCLIFFIAVAYIVECRLPTGQPSLGSEKLKERAKASDFSDDRKLVKALSRRLNSRQESLQQMTCRLEGDRDTSSTGGWCSQATKTQHVCDEPLAAALAHFFAGRTVVSLGDGPGEYRRRILATGLVAGYDAFDGAPSSANATNGRVRFIDLTLPQYWLPEYDWVMSLEVAEHVPAEYESTLVDNLARPAREGIVFSWATPGQGGFHHVNERPPQYVEELMRHRGFRRDANASQSLRDVATLGWLKSNINVYYRIH